MFGFTWGVVLVTVAANVGANAAFAMLPGLTTGACDLLQEWGTEEQKEVYLTKMVSGQWSGTMNLTEPHAGSDVGLSTTKAVPSPSDDGSWLMDWLETDVLAGLDSGDAYTNDVPFKSAHAPKDSDGILEPAPVHFRGPLVLISGPSGGSHLDQFVSIVVDNGLGAVVQLVARRP